MFFTREDILKIQQALLQLGVKDSELPSAESVTYDDTLSIVQDGKNKQIGAKDFCNQISLWKREDFINITDKYDKHYISLIKAINLVPVLQRKEGLVITFQDVEDNWEIYQFRGNITEFFEEDKWFNLYDYRNNIIQSIVPDEEDLTASTPDENGNSLVSLKDRVYDPTSFSGKGYKILRKNIQSINIAVTKIKVEFSPSSDGTLSFSINGKETQVSVSVSVDNTTTLVADKIATKLTETMTEYEVSKDASTITLTRKFSGSITPSIFSASTTGVVCTVTDSSKRESRNIITKDMINKPNTIYEIRYDFDLNNQEINIPENCILKFDGGNFSNGTINGTNTIISSSLYKIFDSILFKGTWNNPNSYPEWFGAKGDGIVDDYEFLQIFVNSRISRKLIFTNKYNISKQLNISYYTSIEFKKQSEIKAIDSMDYLIKYYTDDSDGSLFEKETLDMAIIQGSGTLNGNGLAKTCLYADMGNYKVCDLIIKNFVENGIYSKALGNYNDITINNIELDPNTYTNTVGILVGTNDSTYFKITCIDCSIGFKILSGIGVGNYFNTCKCWISHNEYWENSVAFDNFAKSIHLINCRHDTVRYLIKSHKAYDCSTAINCEFVNNSSVVSSSLLKEFPPCILYRTDNCNHNNSYIAILDYFTEYYMPTKTNDGILGVYEIFTIIPSLPSSNHLPSRMVPITLSSVYKDINNGQLFFNQNDEKKELCYCDEEGKIRKSNGILKNRIARLPSSTVLSNLDKQDAGYMYADYNNNNLTFFDGEYNHIIKSPIIVRGTNAVGWHLIGICNLYYNKEYNITAFCSRNKINIKIFLIQGYEENIACYISSNLANPSEASFGNIKIKIVNKNSYLYIYGYTANNRVMYYSDEYNYLGNIYIPDFREGEEFVLKEKETLLNIPIYYEYNIGKIAPNYDGIIKCGIKDGIPYYHNGYEAYWVDALGNDINAKKSGSTEERPIHIKAGYFYFDTTLSKPIWWTGTQWVDSTGANV